MLAAPLYLCHEHCTPGHTQGIMVGLEGSGEATIREPRRERSNYARREGERVMMGSDRKNSDEGRLGKRKGEIIKEGSKGEKAVKK